MLNRTCAVPALILSLVAVTPNGASAQAPDSTTTPAARGMADTVTVLPTFHVEGQRTLVPDRTTGTSMRLDRSKLVRFQPVTTGDALRAAPGVDLVKTGSWDTRVSLRGLSGERVLVMVDGVRLQTGRGHGAQLSLVPLDQLESIELMPGGGSTQFGSDALAGVVNLVTHRSLFASDPSATVTFTGRVAAPEDGGGAHTRLRILQPRYGFEFSGGFNRIGALVTPDGRVNNSGGNDQDFAARAAAQAGPAVLDYEHSRHYSYDIGLPAFTTAAGGSGAYPMQEREADRFEVTLPRAGLRPEMRLLGVAQTFRSGFDEVTVESLFVRRVYRSYRVTDSYDHVNTTSRSLQPSLQYGPVRMYGEWRHENTGGPRAIQVSNYSTAGDLLVPPSLATGYSVPPAERTVLAGGLYAGATRYGFRAEGGARFDHQRSRADSLTGSFTSVLDVTDRRWSVEGGLSRPVGLWTPYVHAGSGFRAPNLEERFFSGPFHGAMLLFGNPALLPERTLTGEAGVRVTDAFDGRLASARVSLYRTHADELITLKYLGMLYGVARFQNVNVHRARLEGVEMAADTRFAGMMFGATAAFPRGRDLETGKPIVDLGAAHANVDMRVPIARGLPQGAIALRVRWTDAVPASGEEGTSDLARPAYWTSDAELSATVYGTRLALAVRNLANTRYREPLASVDEPGRTFTLAMRRDLAAGWLVPHKEH